jgi:hypothetical protein
MLSGDCSLPALGTTSKNAIWCSGPFPYPLDGPPRPPALVAALLAQAGAVPKAGKVNLAIF